jgi:hypothetical protein
VALDGGADEDGSEPPADMQVAWESLEVLIFISNPLYCILCTVLYSMYCILCIVLYCIVLYCIVFLCFVESNLCVLLRRSVNLCIYFICGLNIYIMCFHFEQLARKIYEEAQDPTLDMDLSEVHITHTCI